MSVKVMVIDDSALMRKILSHMLQEIEKVTVYKAVRSEKEAVAAIEKEVPDLIFVDAQIPNHEVFKLLKKISHEYTIPTIMICSPTDQKEITLRALELGALDFVLRPNDINKNWNLFKEKLESKIKIHFSNQFYSKQVEPMVKKEKSKFQKPVKAIVIGASTGGPKAIIEVIKHFPHSIGIPVFIVQHMPKGFTASFANRLNTLCKLEVVEAKDGDKIVKDKIYLAPGGKHIVIEDQVIKLNDDDKIHGVKPAVDYLFNSAAKKYKNHLVGVVLTGMGYDGAIGCQSIKEENGYVITQDQETSVIYGMPRNVEEKGFSDEVASLFDIGEILKNMIG